MSIADAAADAAADDAFLVVALCVGGLVLVLVVGSVLKKKDGAEKDEGTAATDPDVELAAPSAP